MDRKIGFDKEGNYHGKYCYFTAEFIHLGEQVLKKQFIERLEIMKGSIYNQPIQLEFNFEGEENAQI